MATTTDMAAALGQALRGFRKARKLKLEDVANPIDYDAGNLSRVERGMQSISPTILERVAGQIGVSLSDLFATAETIAQGGEPRFELPALEEPPAYRAPRAAAAEDTHDSRGHSFRASEYTFIPRYGVDFSAGPGAAVEHEAVDEHLAFRTSWLRQHGLQPDRITVINARGDSMAERIQDGDILLVDTSQTEIKDGLIYALNIGGEARIKRLYRRIDGTIVLHSDNRAPQYRDEEVPKHEQELLNIVGRVVWVGGNI